MSQPRKLTFSEIYTVVDYIQDVHDGLPSSRYLKASFNILAMVSKDKPEPSRLEVNNVRYHIEEYQAKIGRETCSASFQDVFDAIVMLCLSFQKEEGESE